MKLCKKRFIRSRFYIVVQDIVFIQIFIFVAYDLYILFYIRKKKKLTYFKLMLIIGSLRPVVPNWCSDCTVVRSEQRYLVLHNHTFRTRVVCVVRFEFVIGLYF